MRKGIVFFPFFLLLSCLFGAEDQSRTGILIDTLCGETSAHNSEKVAHHTVACSLVENCRDSGFGIVVEKTFLKFDERGDKLALGVLEQTPIKKKLEVRVWGDFDFEGETVRVIKLEAQP